MTGLKISSLLVLLCTAETLTPIPGIPFVEYGAMGLCAFMVWQMWKMIERREQALAAKDAQIQKIATEMITACNALAKAMEEKPCLHGQVPQPNWTDNQEQKL
jgi:hypothetical protein